MKTYELLQQVTGGSPNDLQRQDPAYPRIVEPLFSPMYWTTNGEGVEDFVTISNGSELYAPFRVHSGNTYIGLIWTSIDDRSHAGMAYDDYTDYSGVTWVFDFEASATCPVINEETRALTLDIRDTDGNIFFLGLAPYADTPSGRSARITLDFDNLSVTRASDSAIVTLDATRIGRITFGMIADSYNINNTSLLTTPEDCWYRITTVSVTGGADFTVANHVEPIHDIGMCTAYDNMHILSPERIIKTIKALGYDGKINHYCGVSQYPNRFNNGGVQQIVETIGSTINQPCIDWHTDFAQKCVAEGWDVIFSVSYEMYSPYANQAYAQRDRNGALAVTGYSPPSHLLIPTSTNGAMNYLGNVFVDFANIMSSAGLPVIMQVGEPWWWWNVATSLPCLYDNDTLVKFNADTGLFAPTIDSVFNVTDVDVNDNGPLNVGVDSTKQSFLKWCRDELGNSTLYIRDRVKAVHPTCDMTLLLFIPSLFNEGTGIVPLMNFPEVEFAYPNWDFFMTEAYDDVIKGQYEGAERAITIPTETLGYPASQLEYLAGFVPNQELADAFNWTILNDNYVGELWSKVTGNMSLNKSFGIGRQYIWAYTQVTENNFLYRNGSWDTVLDRQLIRPVEVERPAKYVTFAPISPPVTPEDPKIEVIP